MRKTLILSLLLASVGCAAPPPSSVDMTPRFRAGAQRYEGIESFAELETVVKDVDTHFGVMWEATVVSAGPRGAVIDAHVSRVVAKLPGGLLTIDTDSIIPFGSLTGIGRILVKMLDHGFRYTVSPQGDVSLQGWDDLVNAAARDASEPPPPGDGSIPGEGLIRDALARVYQAPPRRQVRHKETWSVPSSYRVATGKGPAVNGVSNFGYVGMGDQRFEFGSEDVKKEGVSVKFGGSAEVVAEGQVWFGKVPVQQGARRGELLLSRDGGQVLMYRELDELSIEPDVGLGAVTVSVELAAFKTGWLFFAEDPWK